MNRGKLFQLQNIAIHHKSNGKSNYLKYVTKNRGSIERNTCVACETYLWRDYQESATTGQTDAGQSDPYVPLWLRRRHKNLEFHTLLAYIYSHSTGTFMCRSLDTVMVGGRNKNLYTSIRVLIRLMLLARFSIDRLSDMFVGNLVHYYEALFCQILLKYLNVKHSNKFGKHWGPWITDVFQNKQNRESTEGYSKSIVGKITTSSEKDWSQQVEHMQVPKGRDQVSGGVSVPCRHATPVANVLWKPLKIR